MNDSETVISSDLAGVVVGETAIIGDREGHGVGAGRGEGEAVAPAVARVGGVGQVRRGPSQRSARRRGQHREGEGTDVAKKKEGMLVQIILFFNSQLIQTITQRSKADVQ